MNAKDTRSGAAPIEIFRITFFFWTGECLSLRCSKWSEVSYVVVLVF